MATRFVVYRRVSTRRQGASGLGLDGQQAAVDTFLASRAGEVVATFTEVESGRKNQRPELLRAIDHCHLTGATLLVAKLDRLSRNAAFLMTLRDTGVAFIAADLPDANAMTVGVMALVAQHEAEAISSRTKAALAEAKRRGVRLGGYGRHVCRDIAHDGAKASAAVRKARADDHARRVAAEIARVAPGGSLRQIAAALNERGIRRPSGAGEWGPTSVRSVLQRAAAMA